MLSVRHGARAIEFYKSAFGAHELFRRDKERGEVIAHLNFSPDSLGGGTVRLLMMSDDPDAAFDRAVAAAEP